MGWGSGSEIASGIEAAMKPYMDRFSVEEIQDLGRVIAGLFEDSDCDTLRECDGFIGDASTLLEADRDGAPSRPADGELFERDGEVRRFDGKRWIYQDGY